MGESNSNLQPDIFRNLVCDSKLLFLCRAVEQYEQFQSHLNQNEDHQRRVGKFLEYNRIKLLELDLARQQILPSTNVIVDASIPTPKPPADKSSVRIMKSRPTTTKHPLPLQRPSQLSINMPNQIAGQHSASLIMKDSIESKANQNSSIVYQNDGLGWQGNTVLPNLNYSAASDSKEVTQVITNQRANRIMGNSTMQPHNVDLRGGCNRENSSPINENKDSIRFANGSTDESDHGRGFHHSKEQDHELLLKLRSDNNSFPALQKVSNTHDMANSGSVSEQYQRFLTHGIPAEVHSTSVHDECRTVSSQDSLTGIRAENDHAHHSFLDDDGQGRFLYSHATIPHWRYSFNFDESDVLFERGNFAYNHPGNRVYRQYIKSLQDEYMKCKKQYKHLITNKVLHYIKVIRKGRFLAFDAEGSGQWEELSEDSARRKIGQSLREKNKRYMPPPRSRKNSKRIYDMFDCTNASHDSDHE